MRLQLALSAVLSAIDLPQRNALLESLSRSLAETPPTERQALLQEFLASRRDANLGGRFSIGQDGLTASPTLRVWLLNEQAKLDPAGAAALGRQVLASMDSPDEWAIALRCLVVGDPSQENRALAQEKTLALLGNEEWQREPTSGYLQAFDVAVSLKDQAFAPVLSGLLQQTNQPALARAAFVALDRLTLTAPVEYLQTLQEQSNLLEGRETARASFFARADPTDATQRQILERYLLDPRRKPEELNSFAAIFPNANQFISHNLITQQKIPEGATLYRKDAAALLVIRQWQNDPRFAPLAEPLHTIEARLLDFLRQSPTPTGP